jgi:hypothetical protein
MKVSSASTTYSSCLYITGGTNINVRSNILLTHTIHQNTHAVFNNGGALGSISKWITKTHKDTDNFLVTVGWTK